MDGFFLLQGLLVGKVSFRNIDTTGVAILQKLHAIKWPKRFFKRFTFKKTVILPFNVSLITKYKGAKGADWTKLKVVHWSSVWIPDPELRTTFIFASYFSNVQAVETICTRDLIRVHTVLQNYSSVLVHHIPDAGQLHRTKSSKNTQCVFVFLQLTLKHSLF